MGILIQLLLGLFTKIVDRVLIAPTIENFAKNIYQKDQHSNQELEKALNLCFLSALQTIARESHKELIGSSIVQSYREIIVYPPEHREDLQWLDRKLKQLVKDIKQVKSLKYIDITLQSTDEIASLLRPEGQLLVKEKLIAAALKDDFIPQLYAAKVKDILFEKMCDNFAVEIKYNPVLRDIIELKLLANINKNLANEKIQIQDLENSVHSSEARRKIKLEFDIEKLDTAHLEAIVQHLQKLLNDGSIKLRRIEEGCMELQHFPVL